MTTEQTIDILYGYASQEVLPAIAAKSELAAGVLNGAMRASRHRAAESLAGGGKLLETLGIMENGALNKEAANAFIDGLFETKPVMSVTLGSLLEYILGRKIDFPLLDPYLNIGLDFTKDDATKLLARF